MRRVLVVNLREEERKKVTRILQRAGFQVVSAEDGESAIRALYQSRPDLVIMGDDSIEGRDLCPRIRDSARIPIIVVGKGDEFSTVIMLELGADMYLRELVSSRELVARVQALLRRYRASNPDDPKFDPETKCVELGSRVVELTPTEFRLFSFLALNQARFVPVQRLIREVWGAKTSPDTLHFYIRSLKRKFGIGETGPCRLLNRRGEGYCFVRESEGYGSKSGHNAQALSDEIPEGTSRLGNRAGPGRVAGTNNKQLP